MTENEMQSMLYLSYTESNMQSLLY